MHYGGELGSHWASITGIVQLKFSYMYSMIPYGERKEEQYVLGLKCKDQIQRHLSFLLNTAYIIQNNITFKSPGIYHIIFTTSRR